MSKGSSELPAIQSIEKSAQNYVLFDYLCSYHFFYNSEYIGVIVLSHLHLNVYSRLLDHIFISINL